MTTTWTIPKLWEGETVAVLATGPSMSQDVADALSGHKRIVVNEGYRLAPDADMLVAMDGNWPQEYRDFPGMRVTGVKDDDLDAYYIGPRWERVRLENGAEVEIHNSGLTAIRVASALGAKKIIIAGFDGFVPGERIHYYDDEVDTGAYVGVTIGLKNIIAELSAKGVTVERFTAPIEDQKPAFFGKKVKRV